MRTRENAEAIAKELHNTEKQLKEAYDNLTTVLELMENENDPEEKQATIAKYAAAVLVARVALEGEAFNWDEFARNR